MAVLPVGLSILVVLGFPMNRVEPEEIVYGCSGSGKYDLLAYKLGKGEDTLLLTFGVHGWDDGFDGDGDALAGVAEEIVERLGRKPRLLEGWTIYVIPRVNPDGVYEGWTNDGPGRTTLWRYEDGESVYGDGLGIDINRSFPYCFEPEADSRNYNGTQPLQCAEAQALADFTASVMGPGRNLLLDIHGWEEGLFLSNPESVLHRAVAGEFGCCVPAGSLEKGYGCYSAWAAYELGWESGLLELPACVNSRRDFSQEHISSRLRSMVELILKNG